MVVNPTVTATKPCRRRFGRVLSTDTFCIISALNIIAVFLQVMFMRGGGQEKRKHVFSFCTEFYVKGMSSLP